MANNTAVEQGLRKRKAQSNLASLDRSLGGFDWIDRDSKLRRWFSDWLTTLWAEIYSESLQLLGNEAYRTSYNGMESFLKELPVKLEKLSSADQLAIVHTEARKFGLDTARERIEMELFSFLDRYRNVTQKPRKDAPSPIPWRLRRWLPMTATILKASPWCNQAANEAHIFEQAGRNLPYQLYPKDQDMQLVLQGVISEFGSREIWREPSPEMSRLFEVRRTLAKLDEAVKRLPTGSPPSAGWRAAESGLRTFSASLEAEVSRLASEPDAPVPSLRVRRLQRALFFAVRRLCKPKDGPDKLAVFIQTFLKDWPYVPAGMAVDLENHFNVDNRRELVRGHLGLAERQANKAFRALSRVLQTIVFREQLRSSLLMLAHHARRRAEQRRKGWEHLRKVLKAVFDHIRREPTVEEQIRNFERSNFPELRNLTREQRMQLVPECGNDPDHSVRDLNKKEKMILFERYFGTRNPRLKNPLNGNSLATQYGRAAKAVRRELGLG